VINRLLGDFKTQLPWLDDVRTLDWMEVYEEPEIVLRQVKKLLQEK
jgi:hypothetical protein